MDELFSVVILDVVEEFKSAISTIGWRYCAVFFITVLFIMVPIHGNAKSTKVVWYIFIIAFATFAFYSEPSVSDDLYRHYKLIDSIRNGNDVNTSLFMFKFILIMFQEQKIMVGCHFLL